MGGLGRFFLTKVLKSSLSVRHRVLLQGLSSEASSKSIIESPDRVKWDYRGPRLYMKSIFGSFGCFRSYDFSSSIHHELSTGQCLSREATFFEEGNFNTKPSRFHHYFSVSCNKEHWTPTSGPVFPPLAASTVLKHFCRSFSASADLAESVPTDDFDVSPAVFPPRIKFKRLNKTAKHIMQILDKEAVEEVRSQREIPFIRAGQIIEMKVEVPENKRRLTIMKGIVIAKRNAGLNTTFRLRRLVAGVGVESLFMLYSPNIKEIRVLDRKKVKRAKLYYLRERMNPLKNK